jgi:transglutaminase-like putative cysteine protease
MKIRAGYEIAYSCPQPTPMILMLSVLPERAADLVTPDALRISADVPVQVYRDGFGNTCHFLRAPAGPVTFANDFIIGDSGLPDEVVPDAIQHPLEDLPVETLVYLLGSRYCETDRLNEMAWSLFGKAPRGWPLVQTIVDYVHERISFGYQHARPTKTAWDAHEERLGVCRDYAHLAITLCRCMNIPARYCTGYLGDIGVPKDPAPMDFSAWFEVFLGGRWYTFDARHNKPRIGRVLMARGRDATDVAMVTSFGACTMTGFKVVTDELEDSVEAAA